MDKRTILFVFLLSISFFLVNLFFEGRNQETLKAWNKQQAIKKQKTIEQLENELAQRTLEKNALPVVPFFSKKEDAKPLGYGIETETGLIVLDKEAKLPKTIYTKEKALSQVLLAKKEGIAFFSSDPNPLLSIASLPDFGKFTLHIVLLKDEGFDVLIGDVTDKHFSVPKDTLDILKKELKEENIAKEPLKRPKGIALLQSGSKLVPVALYQGETPSIKYLEEIAEISPILKKDKTEKIQDLNKKEEEKLYVLENEYQQLVFSNIGGSLKEINLPFTSKQDKKSVVRPIEFDREIVETKSANARFPLGGFYTPKKEEKSELEYHAQGKEGGYYPLIRRDLVEKSGTIKVEPRFYALNIVSEYPEVSELVYKMTSFDASKITFEADQGHRKIIKTFSISDETKGAPYCVDLEIRIEGDARGLWLTSGVPEVEWISGSPAPALKVRLTRNGKPEVNTIDLPKDSTVISSIFPDWICNSNGFLGVILDPLTEIDPGYRVQFVSGLKAPSRLIALESSEERFKAKDLPGYLTLLPLKATGGSMHFRIFSGPFSDAILQQVDHFFEEHEGYNPDYMASQTFHGWFSFISEPFAKFLFVLMKFFYALTGSWAFSIILLTVALRLMLYPLNAWSTKSMVKMQKISPQVIALQEKYKKDPNKAKLAIMNLYREEGVNPVSGCLPLLIQMPFLIGMFDLLKSTFELRGASFIPGWIDNLTSPDVLFSWKTPILPLIGNQFHLLPFLLGGVMFLQQRLMTTLPKDPNEWTEQQRQQRTMGTIMTVVFTVMFYNFPSGLNIYWLSSMLLGILQQWWITKKLKSPIKTT